MSNEAKTTKAYKISPELKEKLERLAAESGLETQEAFIEQMAALYELQRLKEGNGSGYAKQIDELEYHSRRSVELFIGMINTEAAERLELSQQHDEKVASLSAELFVQQEELARITKENEAREEQIQALKKTDLRNEQLIEEYRSRIDGLTKLAEANEAEAKEAEQLRKQLAEAERRIADQE
uniref:hypothetical protein n=1 Tax=Bartonella sp. CL29QHWL TaxID=3243522 RepID=UPI0035CEAD67